jgi:hypothetical protein
MFQSLTINISSPPILLLNPKLVLRSTNKSSKTLKHAITRLTNFYSDPAACELWNTVQAWTVTAALGTFFLVHLKENEQNFTQQYLSAIFQFLSCSRNLRSLDLARLDLRREHWVILESLPALETLRLVSCFFSPSSPSHLERLKLKELEITGTSFGSRSIDGYLVFMLCNPAYLEKLTLNDPLVTHIVLASLSSLGRFPHLTYLNVFVNTFSHGDFLRFLAAIPSLTTLRMFPWSAYIMPDHPLPALPFLRSYKGSPHLLSHVVPGRPVDHVCLDLQVVKAPEDSGQLDDYIIYTDLISTVLDISRSTVPVKTLKIESFLPALRRLTAIAQHLSDLLCLDLVLIGTPPPVRHVHTMLATAPCRIIDAPISPQENLVISPGSRFEDLDDNPLDASETIRVRRIVTLSLPLRIPFRA